MTTTEQAKYPYDGTYELKLLYLFLSDPNFYLTNYTILDPNYFNETCYVNTASAIRDYHTEFKKAPIESTLKTILKNAYPKEEDVYDRLVSVIFACDRKDLEYIESKAIEFGRRQELILAIGDSISLLKYEDFDGVEKRLKKALFTQHAPLTIGHDFFKEVQQRRLGTSRSVLPTLIKSLDNILNGGIGRGELFVVIAPPGVGKTSSLVNFGKAMLVQGKHLLYITLEMSEEAIAFKFEASASGIPINQLHDPTMKSDILKVLDRYNGYGGSLYIKWFPMYKATYLDVEAYIEYFIVNSERIPDVIIVDYPDLIKIEGKDTYAELGELYGKFRALAGIYNCAVMCASQVGRGAMSKDVITQADIAESFKKCGIADVMLSISQTETERKINVFRYYIAKNRWGRSQIAIPVESYMDKSLIIDTDPGKVSLMLKAVG